MNIFEQLFVQFILNFVPAEQLNAALGDPRTVAIIIGVLVSISTACLGVFLILRQMSMTSDAISHTVLLGIVVAFLVMVGPLGMEPDLNSPLLVIGAAVAGVATVVLTELIYRSGLVKQDAALGLAFPFLFALSVLLISRYADQVHLDTDAVLVGEIGVAWANTNSQCLENCDEVVITPEDSRATVGRVCINCSRESGVTPRSPQAQFEETCANCGTYSAAEAWRERLIPEPPLLVFWPRSFTLMGVITLLNVVFVTLFYKELKLSSFDSGLAAALGFRPGLLTYALMMLVSLTAVGAFDAVGSILVVAFFIIPAATLYLLTDRLAVMLIGSPIIGTLSAITGYELARGNFLGFPVSRLLEWLDDIIGLQGYTVWNVSISASIVMMTFFFFLAAWVISPRYGLISTVLRRQAQRQNFANQLVLGHIYNHQHSPEAAQELAVSTLHEHMNWSPEKTRRVLGYIRARGLVEISGDHVHLTARGEQHVITFRAHNLGAGLAAQP